MNHDPLLFEKYLDRAEAAFAKRGQTEPPDLFASLMLLEINRRLDAMQTNDLGALRIVKTEPSIRLDK